MDREYRRSSRYKPGSRWKPIIAVVLAVALIVSAAPFFPGLNWQAGAADELSGNTVQPVLVVSGEGVLGGSAYSVGNVGNEKSYTLDELRELEEIEQLYSAINTNPTCSIYLGKGISIDTLLQNSNVGAGVCGTNTIDIIASDGYTVCFDPEFTGPSATRGKPLKTPAFDVERYYYPNINSLVVGLNGDNYTYSNEENAAVGGVPARTMLAWERGGERGQPEKVPTTTDELYNDEKPLLLLVGQQNVWEQNNPLFNKTVNKVLVGDALTETAVTINEKKYTRSDILMMERADRSYTYSTEGGSKTDYVRGVPLAALLKGYDGNDKVSFTAADSYPVNASGLTVGELTSGNYLLAYEKGTGSSDLAGIYDTAKNKPSIHGYFALYGDAEKPAKMIDSITVTPASGIDFVHSIYKHINNGGISGQEAPYNIDAITGATLTIEGPGVTTSVPLPIRELESQDTGAYRGTYTDTRANVDWTLQYEGIRLSHIIHNMTSGANGIHLTGDAHKVLIKNRVRQTVAEFSLEEIAEAEAAGKPIIIAYGTGKTDDSSAAPFVYDGAAGYKPGLDNDDGPIKLVYDKTAFNSDPNPDYTEFGNVAYIYVAEEVNPGYKHNVAPYDTPENAQYVLTVTGDKIGREVNYTVKQLEDMVVYDVNGTPVADGMGHRGEYSLANSSYWYVNEYEGVQLWKLLLKSGLSASAATGADKDTLVQFSATDNYKDFDKFTFEQIANPDLFKYYEKNPADLNDGKYTSDDAVDLRGTGYPVLVAYGVNSYPYVIKNTLDGYMSGLSNDGGPLRIISGKLTYNHANGSRQAKLLDKVIAGEDKYYSTHKYNPSKGGVYQTVAENATLNVKVISGASIGGTVLKDQTYKVGDLEELLYGGSLTTAQLKEAKIKGFYEAYKNGSFYNDLYEGLDLKFFLEHVVQLPGYKGTITFSDGANKLELGLEEALAFSGCNDTTRLSGLSPLIAYAKNGAPMVNSKNEKDGYEGDVVLAQGTEYEHTITVKNNGGPLAVLFPRATAGAGTADSLSSLTSITINLSADLYAHTEPPYSDLAGNTITISGEGTRLNAPRTFTVADLEGKQTMAVTGDYNIKKNADNQSQLRYRGIPLYNFLSSTDVGLKPNADQVIVTCSDNSSYTFSLSEVYKSNYINGQNPAINNLRMILAYGSAAVTNPAPEDGRPLVRENTTEAGYDAAYGNSGGPIRLVVGQTDADEINSGKILKDVTAIEVTASDMVSWNHSSSEIYRQYLGYEFQFQVVDAGNKTLLDKSYTLEQLEAMAPLLERENITWVGTQEWEGVNLWKFVLQEAATIPGIADPTSVTVFAEDGFSKELRSTFGLDALNNGIKDGELRIPIIIGYAVNGYPLVPSNISEGYTALADNSYGPLRLMTHANQGACLKNTTKMVVKVGAGGSDPQPVDEKDFNIYGLPSGTVAMDIKAIKNISQGQGGKVAKTYNWFGDHDGDSDTPKQAASDTVKGAYLADILASQGISGSNVTVDIVTTDGYAPDHYKQLNLSDIQAKDYFVAYDISTDGGTSWNPFSDADKGAPPAISTVRIYRNYDDGSSTWFNRVTNVKGVTVKAPAVFDVYPADGESGHLPLAGVRAVEFDQAGGLWISTYGGGVAYKAAGADSFTIYNTVSTPALVTATVSGLAVDAAGGVWLTQDGSYTDPAGSHGAAYMKDGQITFYKASDDPPTIPHNYVLEVKIDAAGNLWFGSSAGLTKYNPATGLWTTWDQKYTDKDGDSFPAQAIDNLTLDGSGGIWIGFIPNGSGTPDDPRTGGFAHMTADGNITPYITEYDGELGGWIRDIAVDHSGGAWVVASGSYPGVDNVGGTVWYVNKQGQATKFTGKQLLGAGRLTGYSELRMVAVDPDGGLWFGSSGDGVFYIANPSTEAPFTITAQYCGSAGSWPAAGIWDNIYSLKFVGSTLYVSSNGGLAFRTFQFNNSGGEEPPAVIESFTISGVGSGDIDYYVGGAHDRTFKGLAEGAGKADGSYPYDGVTHYVKGALLKDLLADAGAENDIKVTIKTSDNYTKDSYQNIPYADIVSKDYFVAYDVGEGAQTLGKIADTDNNGVTASFRIYRHLDAGAAGNKDNRIKGVTGVVVSKATGGGGEIPGDYDLTINGKGVRDTAHFTIGELKSAPGLETISASYDWLNSFGTRGSDNFKGVYLANLLDDVVGLTSNAKSITVTAGDGYYRSFNLDSKDLGVYWTDSQGNQLMLAWERNGAPIDLQLVVGQIDADHVNKPMWVSNVETITVNVSSTNSGSGTPGGYEGTVKPSAGAPAPVQVTANIVGNTASFNISSGDIGNVLNRMKKATPAPTMLEIDAASGTPDGLQQTEVTLSPEAIAALAGEGNLTLRVTTRQGVIMLPPEVLKMLAAGSQEPVKIIIADAGEAGKALGSDRPVVDIGIVVGNQEITDLGGNQIRASVPYDADPSENGSSLLVYYINENGESIPVRLSIYDAENDCMVFDTMHLSLYAVGYNGISFNDIPHHWAKDNIEFLAAREIIKGRSAGYFEPDGNVTRAEFVTILANSADGIVLAGNGNVGFTDVLSGDWYAPYINWAAASGIVSGYGDGRFGPNDLITREQIAVMTDNFIKAMQVALKDVQDRHTFTDETQISSWAAAAVAKMQQRGIISGRPDGTFAPQANATRAEAATLIKGYLVERLGK